LPTATTSIAPVDFMGPTDFMVEEREGSRVASTDSRHHTLSRAPILARSVALTMEDPPAAFPLAGSPASAEVFMEVEVSTAAAAAAGNSVRPQPT
jgi:hypothetical protein